MKYLFICLSLVLFISPVKAQKIESSQLYPPSFFATCYVVKSKKHEVTDNGKNWTGSEETLQGDVWEAFQYKNGAEQIKSIRAGKHHKIDYQDTGNVIFDVQEGASTTRYAFNLALKEAVATQIHSFSSEDKNAIRARLLELNCDFKNKND